MLFLLQTTFCPDFPLISAGRPGSSRLGSVQPSPAGGDGFSTPIVQHSQNKAKDSDSILECVRAQALAAHVAQPSSDDKATAHLTDDLLNI